MSHAPAGSPGMTTSPYRVDATRVAMPATTFGVAARLRTATLIVLALTALAAGAAMAQVAGTSPAAPVQSVPAPGSSQPDWKALYEDAVESYNKGAYGNAIRKLRDVVNSPQADDATRLAALKYLAFSYCVSPGPNSTKLPLCRQAFVRALRISPAFGLSPGERGHPVWGREFQAARRELGQGATATDPSSETTPPPGALESASVERANAPSRKPAGAHTK